MFCIKIATVFFTIILLIHLKWPLWGAVLIASLETAFLYGIPAMEMFSLAGSTLLSLYCLVLLGVPFVLRLLQALLA